MMPFGPRPPVTRYGPNGSVEYQNADGSWTKGTPPAPAHGPAAGASQAAASAELTQLREKVMKLEAELAKVRATQGLAGVVLELKEDGGKDWALVSSGANTISRFDVTGMALETGVPVLLTKGEGPMKVTGALPDFVGYGGRVVEVVKVHGDFFEWNDSSEPRCSRVGKFKLTAKDRVLLDGGAAIAVRRIPKLKAKSHATLTGVSWDDIGGLEDVKLQLREAVEDPIVYSDLYRSVGQEAPKGAALVGPAGTGKTHVGRALYTALAALQKGKSLAASGWLYVKGPEIVSKYYGDSEAAVRLLFSSAREHFEEHGYPAIIFIDEADGLLARRGAGRNEGMEKTIVPQFLAEMDGLDKTHAFVLVATNRIDILDPALLRDDRLDLKIFVPRPDLVAAKAILKIHLRGRPGDAEALSEYGSRMVFSGLTHRVLHLEGGSKVDFPLHEVVSGAMLKGLVRRAAQFMLRRAKLGGDATITTEDMAQAGTLLLRGERLVSQDAEMMRFATERQLSVVRVEVPT